MTNTSLDNQIVTYSSSCRLYCTLNEATTDADHTATQNHYPLDIHEWITCNYNHAQVVAVLVK